MRLLLPAAVQKMILREEVRKKIMRIGVPIRRVKRVFYGGLAEEILERVVRGKMA